MKTGTRPIWRGRGAVDVARDDELWSGAALEELAQRVAVVLGEADLVELGEADADRRVVHREDHRAVRRLQLALDPADPLRADRAAGLTLDLRVDVHDADRAAVNRVVEELAGGGDLRVVRERVAEVLAPVVVAGDGVDGHLERLEELADPLVLGRVAVVGQIARQQHRDRRRIHLADRRDRPLERDDRVGVVGMEPNVGIRDLRDRGDRAWQALMRPAGRLSAHGLSASSCAASESRVASSFGRPTSWTARGMPFFERPIGTEAAGLPRWFHGPV